MIKTLKENNRLSKSKVLLNGWSEVATLAPLFALKYPDMADALFLCGYSNVNLKDMQVWQCSKIDGGNTMLDWCFSAIERKDNDWLLNIIGLSAEWFSESYNLKSNNDLLPTLELPIYIYNGALDGFCDVQGAYKIKDVFAQLGKTNLNVSIFDDHGHGPDCSNSTDGNISEGINSLLNAINSF